MRLGALADAGIAVVQRISSVAGHAPPALYAELIFYSESLTSQIPRVRSRDAISAWLDEQLATLGRHTTYYLVDWKDIGAWLQVIPPADPGWLARLWYANPEGAVLALGGDGERMLYLFDDYATRLCSVALPCVELIAMRDDRYRLDTVLGASPGLLRVPSPPSPRAFRAAELYAGAPMLTLPVTADHARRDAWVCDAFARWRRPDQVLGDQLGPFEWTLADTDRIAMFEAYLDAPERIAEIWRRADHGRLAVLADDFSRALAFDREGEVFTARMNDLAP